MSAAPQPTVLDVALAFCDAEAYGVRTEIRDRFVRRINANGECWTWSGHLLRGYGRFRADGRFHLAHRFAWLMHAGPVPAGLQLDHLCRERSCVRPGHLEPVTNRENSLRATGKAAINAAKTHCPAGHPYDLPNTYLNPAGRRECITCRSRRNRERYLRLTGRAA